MPLVVILRRFFLIILLGLPQYFWLARAWRATYRYCPNRIRRWGLASGTAVLISAIILVLYDRIAGRIIPHSVSYVLAPVIQLWIFSSTIAFFLMLPFLALDRCWREVKKLLHSKVPDTPRDLTRRTIIYHAASAVGALPFAGAIYGYTAERLRFQTVGVDVPIANLPLALDGLRILQLSDIHVGDLMPIHEVARAVAIANELSAHMVVITGDFLTSREDPLEDCIAELGRLRAPLGVFGCNGNHEIYAGAEALVESLFQHHGMRLLRQSTEQIRWNGADLNVIGIDYQRVPFTGRVIPPPLPISSLIRRDMPNLLLSHNPNTFYSASELGIELSLAGHTHGGQVNIEILNSSFNVARFMTDFVAGLYRMSSAALPLSPTGLRAESCLYVNRGLGTLGFPARIGAHPEITLLTLHPA